MFPSIEQFSIVDNPVCSISHLSLFCHYILPRIKFVNDAEVTVEERVIAKSIFAPFFKTMNLSKNAKFTSSRDVLVGKSRRLITPSAGGGNRNSKGHNNDDHTSAIANDYIIDVLRSSVSKYAFMRSFDTVCI